MTYGFEIEPVNRRVASSNLAREANLIFRPDRGILAIEGAGGDRALLLAADLRKILPERLNLLALANFCVFGD
jgi:hypothetical protein